MTDTAPEPIVGFRTWRVDNDRLAPNLNYSRYIDQDAWLNKQATAKCHGRLGLCDNAYNCTCGLHVYSSFDMVPCLSLDCPIITGAVVAWGSIIQHEWGFRAEHARPLAFTQSRHCRPSGCYCTIDPSVPARVGDKYELPVLDADELIAYAGWFGDMLPIDLHQA